MDFWIRVYLLGNFAALLLVFVALWRASVARAAFALLLTGAGAWSLTVAVKTPAAFAALAPWAWRPARAFLEGLLTNGPAFVVVPLAVLQLACGLMLAFGDRRTARQGMLAGGLFFAALAPLGLASAFPATLVLAVAAGITWAAMPEWHPLRGLRLRHGGRA